MVEPLVLIPLCLTFFPLVRCFIVESCSDAGIRNGADNGTTWWHWSREFYYRWDPVSSVDFGRQFFFAALKANAGSCVVLLVTSSRESDGVRNTSASCQYFTLDKHRQMLLFTD